MIHCRECGRVVALGSLENLGVTFEAIVTQPVKDGTLVFCASCYASLDMPKVFPDEASTKAKGLADFGEAIKETSEQAKERLLEKVRPDFLVGL